MDEENSSIIPEVQQHGLFQNLSNLLGPDFGTPSAEQQAPGVTL
jgi:hypothetical protein